MHAFEGFKPEDFKTGVTGTTWRKELAEVICKISGYKSKIPYNYTEIYFGIGRHVDDKEYQSKLYVGIYEEMLYYGFYIEKGYPSEKDAREAGESPEKFKKLVMDKTWDWTRFRENINAINEKLMVASLKHGLITEVRVPSKPEEKTEEALFFRFRGIIEDFEFPPTSWCDLSILKEVEKSTAVERGTKIVDDICEVFDMLHPIYAITSNNFGHRRKK